MIVGLTGGMGSGKTTVLKMFQKLGADVYVADIEAKKLMVTSESLKEKIRLAFGDRSYVNDVLNTSYLAKRVFGNTEKLALLNSFVHPAVQEHFKLFVLKSNADYIVYESALLLQTKVKDICDFIIVVTTPVSTRIDRIRSRDMLSKEDIANRINHQQTIKEMISMADYTIENIHIKSTEKEVNRIHNLLLDKI